MLPQSLSPAETRVLGALVEKELSTPDHYPLSLNALIAACNQTTNREPVTAYDAGAVTAAITTLRRASLVRSFQGIGERVPKYQHLLAESEGLSRAEVAALGVLLLRGPQTMSELRTRATRLFSDDDVGGVEAALEALMSRTPAPAAVRLERRPGQKEVRYAHLLAGDVVYDVDDAVVSPPPVSPDRLAALEEHVQELRTEVADLRAQLATFRRQFD